MQVHIDHSVLVQYSRYGMHYDCHCVAHSRHTRTLPYTYTMCVCVDVCEQYVCMVRHDLSNRVKTTVNTTMSNRIMIAVDNTMLPHLCRLTWPCVSAHTMTSTW